MPLIFIGVVSTLSDKEDTNSEINTRWICKAVEKSIKETQVKQIA